MNKFLPCLLLVIATGWWLPGCRNATNTDTPKDTAVVNLPIEDSITPPPQGDSLAVVRLNQQVLKAIKAGDYEAFARFIHPVQGVRFSLSGFIDTVKDPVFSAARLLEFAGPRKSEKLIWGTDMEGEPINLTLAQFLKQQLYKADFSTADSVGYKNIFRSGVDEQVMKAAYGKQAFVDNYFPGFKKEYDGMDWQSLRLVFDDYNGKPYLIGAVHEEWEP